MADGQNGHQPLYMHKQPATAKRGGAVGVLIAVVVIAVCVGAGFLYFNKIPIRNAPQVIAALWTSVGTNERPWILPEGTPSVSEAGVCLREQDIPCAEADLLAYLKQYPNDSNATAILAITLTQDGRHKEALYYYRRAEAMNVATYDFYAGYAKTLDAMGDTDGAIEKNQAALKLVPSLVDVRGSLADELIRKGRKREALDLLTSFDDKLEAEGYPPYFTQQTQRIEKELGLAVEALPQTKTGQTLVRGESLRGTLLIPVSIDGAEPTLFLVDSGASIIALPSADAQPFMKQGLIRPGDFRGTRPIMLANGTLVTANVYELRSVKVGDREVDDVLAAIYPGQGPRLLGQSFLKRFKSWSIDNDRRVLVLND